MSKIIYCDLIAYGGIHSEFNSSFLKVLIKAYPEYSSIEFYSEKEHGQICYKHLKMFRNIKYRYYSINSKKFIGGIKTILRDLFSCYYLLKVFIRSKKEDMIFIALAYPIAQNFILILQNIYKRNLYLCQHGELEVFVNKNKFHKNKIYYSLVKKVLKSSHIKFVILGDIIFKYTSFLFNKDSKVIIIDHPYNLDYNGEINKNFTPLVIGQIGTGSIGKGTDVLFQLAFLLKKEIEANLLKIKLVGALPSKLYYLDNGLVEYSKQPLNEIEFENGIRNLHYTLQLRNNEISKAVASGTFLDTIKYEKPFFSLENDYILNYISKYPSVNNIFLSIEDMACKIKDIIYKDKASFKREYLNSILYIKELKKEFSLEKIASEFRKQDRQYGE